MPPKLIANKEMIIPEGSKVKITTEFLSFTDEDSEPRLLHYYLLTAPSLGHLELTGNPGIIKMSNGFCMIILSYILSTSFLHGMII